MKIKYTLTYEWEDNEADIISYAEDNNISIENATKELIEWNIENFVERMDTRAANILPVGTNFNFKYKEES